MAFKMKAGKEGPMRKNFGSKYSPMNKPLVGNQHKLPEHLKAKIEASPMNIMDEDSLKATITASKASKNAAKKVSNKTKVDKTRADKAKTRKSTGSTSAVKHDKEGKPYLEKETGKSGAFNKNGSKDTQPNPDLVKHKKEVEKSLGKTFSEGWEYGKFNPATKDYDNKISQEYQDFRDRNKRVGVSSRKELGDTGLDFRGRPIKKKKGPKNISPDTPSVKEK